MAEKLPSIRTKVVSLAQRTLERDYTPDEEERRSTMIEEDDFNALDDSGRPCNVELVVVISYPAANGDFEYADED